ncbi:hypothetical protein [Streptomyces sp. NPDC020377]|uniref:hypothetical protein n=1 Tax=Streptomyces sp. NPDC020377 TaxID=3365070 RepID=UPI0037963AC7
MDANETRPLEDLVRWNGGLSALIKGARSFEPTSTVTFRPDHAVAATEKVIDGLATPDQLIDWAQAVHFAEQVHVEEAHQDLLTQFLFEISTPELFEPVTREVCQRWLRVLQASMAPVVLFCRRRPGLGSVSARG